MTSAGTVVRMMSKSAVVRMTSKSAVVRMTSEGAVVRHFKCIDEKPDFNYKSSYVL